MLSSNYLENTTYNGLPMIETQSVPDESALRALGNLIVGFDVEHLVGVYLIHKHYNLAPNTIMVHDGLVCQPQACSSASALTGVAYMWDGNMFQAFEYGNEERLNLTDEFLSSFADHLEAHNLSGRIALSKADASNKSFMEYVRPKSMTQVCEEFAGEEILPAEATEWKFKRGTLPFGGAVPVVVRGCKRTSTEDHKHYVCCS